MTAADNDAAEKLGHWQWQELIIKAPIPEGLKLTYITLRNFDGVKGCYPKLQTVAERRGLSARTVKRHVAALRRHRYLFSEQSRGPSHYWFTNTEGSPGCYEEKDLLLYDLEPITQIYYATPKDGTVSDGLARSDTPRDVTPNSDTPRDGITEVAVEVASEVQNDKDVTETGPQPTASQCASKDQDKANGEQPPVKQQRHSERPQHEREDLFKLEQVVKQIPPGFNITAASAAAAYDAQGFEKALESLVALQDLPPPAQTYDQGGPTKLRYGKSTGRRIPTGDDHGPPGLVDM